MFVLPAPANLDGLTAIVTGPGLSARYYRSAAETVKTEISLEKTQHNDFRLSVLPNPSNLEGFVAIGASRSLLVRLHGHTTGTLKTVFSFDNALDNGWHFRYSPACWPYSIRQPDGELPGGRRRRRHPENSRAGCDRGLPPFAKSAKDGHPARAVSTPFPTVATAG